MFTGKFSLLWFLVYLGSAILCIAGSSSVSAQTNLVLANDTCVTNVAPNSTTKVTCELWLTSPSDVSNVLISAQSEISDESFSVVAQQSSIAFTASLSGLSSNQLNTLQQALKVQFASISDTPIGLYQFSDSLQVLSPLGGSAQMASNGVAALNNTIARDSSGQLIELFKVMESQSSQHKVIILLSDQIELEESQLNEWIETHGDNVRFVFVQLAVSEFLSNQFSIVTNLAAQTGGYDVLASESEWLSAIADAVTMSGKSLQFTFDIAETCGSHSIAVSINTEGSEYHGSLSLALEECPVVAEPTELPEIVEPVLDAETEATETDTASDVSSESNNGHSEDLSNDQPLVSEQDANEESSEPTELEQNNGDVADESADVIEEQADTNEPLEEQVELDSNDDVATTSDDESEASENTEPMPSENEETIPATEDDNSAVVVYVAIGGLVLLVLLILLVARKKRVSAPQPVNEDSTINAGVVLPKALLLIKDNSVQEQPIKGELTFIGRLDTNNIVLQNDTVSSKHCVIKVVEGQLIIVDLSSTNGTRVNGKQVDESVLSNGDIIDLGEVEINVVIGGENA